MGLAVLFSLFIVGMAVGMPIAFALGVSAVATFLFEGLPLTITFQRVLSGISSFSLLAIPFFIFAGELMLHGGLAQRLVRLASAAVGRVRGGLGIVNVASSMLFGGISGSAVADTSALGSLLIPMMKQKGYDTDYAVNVTVTASTAGIVIPPSHNMLLYVVAAGGGISIGKLFIAGIIPGILMSVCLAVAAYIVAVKRGYGRETFPGWAVLFSSFIVSLPALFTAVIIVGGVLSGMMTVTESGALGAIYAIIVALIVYRELTWEGFKTAVSEAVKTTALVMILVGCASAFAYMLSFYDVPDLLASLIESISSNPVVILLMINVLLLLLGMIMDMAPLILICTPIFLPLIDQIGMDPIQFGIIMMMNLGMGLCTPPVGSCLFVGCAIGGIRIEKTALTMWPFYLAIFIALMLTTYVPFISMVLPNLFG